MSSSGKHGWWTAFSADPVSDERTLLRDLARAKATFQLQTIQRLIGANSIASPSVRPPAGDDACAAGRTNFPPATGGNYSGGGDG